MGPVPPTALTSLSKPRFPKREASEVAAVNIISPDKKPANDNAPRTDTDGMRAIVAIPGDLPITQTEIEVFASLLNDWDGVATNDNEKEPK